MIDPSASSMAYCTGSHACSVWREFIGGQSVQYLPEWVIEDASFLRQRLEEYELDEDQGRQELVFGLHSAKGLEQVVMGFNDEGAGCRITLTVRIKPVSWLGRVAIRALPGDGSAVKPQLSRDIEAIAALAEYTYGITVPPCLSSLDDSKTGAIPPHALIRQMAYQLCRGYALVVLSQSVLSPVEFAAARFSLTHGISACWRALGASVDNEHIEEVVKRVVLPELASRQCESDGAVRFICEAWPSYMAWADLMLPFGACDALAALSAIVMRESADPIERVVESLLPAHWNVTEQWQGRMTDKHAREIVSKLFTDR